MESLWRSAILTCSLLWWCRPKAMAISPYQILQRLSLVECDTSLSIPVFCDRICTCIIRLCRPLFSQSKSDTTAFTQSFSRVAQDIARVLRDLNKHQNLGDLLFYKKLRSIPDAHPTLRNNVARNGGGTSGSMSLLLSQSRIVSTKLIWD